MKTYVKVKMKDSLPCIIYFNEKAFHISSCVTDNLRFDGVTVYEVTIGRKTTFLYREDVPRYQRWYVIRKAA